MIENPTTISPKVMFKVFIADYTYGLICLLITNILGSMFPLLMKQLVEMVQANAFDQFQPLALTIVSLCLCMWVIRVASRHFLLGVGKRIEYWLRTRLFRHILGLSRSYFDQHQTGTLMSRLTNDLANFRMFMGGGVMLFANAFFAYVLVIPFMLLLSWPLTLVTFLIYPVVVLSMRHMARKVKEASNRVQEKLADITALSQDNFAGIATIQSYVKENSESHRFTDTCHRYYLASTDLVRYRVLLYVLIGLAGACSQWAILGEGSREVISGQLTLSGLVGFMLYLERLAWPTMALGWVISSYPQAAASIERVNQVFSVTPSVVSGPSRLIREAPLSFSEGTPLVVNDLCFRYPQSTHLESNRTWVLDHLSFTLQPGERVALVGPIGAGKSTLLHLLVRLYALDHGRILLGDQNIDTFELADLRAWIVLMPQSSFLFTTSLFNNLAYGMAALPSEEQVISWSQTGQLHQEALQLNQSYDTLIGERGVTLSGGQRQRAALIRTLLGEPEILLLDDPFSHVDVTVEQAIIEGLEARQVFKNKITLFSSHRFSWVERADRILVLNAAGQLVGDGSHTQLLDTCSLYRQLYQEASTSRPKEPGQKEPIG